MKHLIAVLCFIAMTSVAHSHSWYSKKTDPKWGNSCCGGSDCARLMAEEPGVITPVEEGYRIRLTHEQAKKINPYTTSGIDAIVEWDRVQTSDDGNYHICIMTSHRDNARGGIYCLFVPPNT